MNELLKQISSYNLFNYLFPGAALCILMDKLFEYSLIVENLFAAFFFYYFVGLVVSRIGSLVVEPTLQKLGFVHFRPYPVFVTATKVDGKLDTLVEINNVYRSMIALPICALLFHAGIILADALNLHTTIRGFVLIVSIGALFILSFKKQTGYICERIDANLNSEREKSISE